MKMRTGLKAVFLAATLALAGCHEPNPAPVEKTNITGEENLKDPIPLNQLDHKGDARIKRIFTALRKSTLGEQLYAYSVATGVHLAWEVDKADNKAGLYSPQERKLTLDANYADAEILQALVHELRHHWQSTATGYAAWINDPLRSWQLNRIVEADACAFSVHFAAEYKKETGTELSFADTFGRATYNTYKAVPETLRSYKRDAVEPCFRELRTIIDYEISHLELAMLKTEILVLKYQIATLTGDYQGFYNEYLNTPDNAGIKAQFSRFLTPGLDPQKTDPEIAALAPDAFAAWLTAMTPGMTDESLQSLNGVFQDLRRDIGERLRNPPLPAPQI